MGWISVKDRLPEPWQEVRVKCYILNPFIKKEDIVVYMGKNKTRLQEWKTCWRVTHWMPLPEPPKEWE